MKILFICSSNNDYGIAPFIKLQGVSIKKLGHDLNYLLVDEKGVKGYIKTVFKLKNYLKKNKVDIIHAHYSLTAFAVSLGKIGSKIPLVVSLLGSDANSNSFQRILIRLFNFIFWSAIIVKSADMKNKIKVKNSYVIPNGVNLQNIIECEKKVDHKKPLTILFASNPQRKVKNHLLAKEACEKLDSSFAALKIIYNLPQKQLYKEIYQADVLISTSLWEGSPNLIKEAMACNCPIVSTDVGDVKWLFGNEKGYFLTTFDVDDIAQKLKYALHFSLENPQTNGRKRIIELGLDTETIAKKIENLYFTYVK